ncbi:MAG: hypothetical protein ACP5I7_07880, partial [Sulfolobales archaeon]
ETSYGSWAFAYAPWAIVLFNNIVGDKLIYRSSLVVWSSGYTRALHGRLPLITALYEIRSKDPNESYKILSGSVALIMNYSSLNKSIYVFEYPGCHARKSLEEEYLYITDPDKINWGSIKGLTEFLYASHIIPTPTFTNLFTANLLAKITFLSLGEISSIYDPSKGLVCQWISGLKRYDRVIIDLWVMIYDYPKDATLYVEISTNDIWRTKPISFTIPRYDQELIDELIHSDENYNIILKWGFILYEDED